MRTIVVTAALAAALVAGRPAGAAAPSGVTTVRSCLTRQHVLVNPGGAFFLPAAVEPRSRQISVSFPFTPGEVGLVAVLLVERSPTAAKQAIERVVRWSVANGGTDAGTRSVLERRGSVVVGWLDHRPQGGASRIVQRCLGPASTEVS